MKSKMFKAIIIGIVVIVIGTGSYLGHDKISNKTATRNLTKAKTQLETDANATSDDKSINDATSKISDDNYSITNATADLSDANGAVADMTVLKTLTKVPMLEF